MVTHLFFTVFSKHILVGNMQENLKKKKKSSITFFFFWRITFNGKMLRKPSAIYAKYSKKKKKALSTKISKENLLEQKSKAEPTALTDNKKSLLFGEVCPASRKKKNIQSFARQFTFLEDFFFSFFSIFFSTSATDFTEKKKLLVVYYTKYHT